MRWRGVCMISPPNRGSAVARKLRGAGFPVGGVFATVYGQAGASHYCMAQPCAVHVASGYTTQPASRCTCANPRRVGSPYGKRQIQGRSDPVGQHPVIRRLWVGLCNNSAGADRLQGSSWVRRWPRATPGPCRRGRAASSPAPAACRWSTRPPGSPTRSACSMVRLRILFTDQHFV